VAQTTAPELTLTIDDQLTRIPWELLHDGASFGLRFAMGRVVSTAKSLAASKPREARGPLKIALVADPRGDLPKALSEATHLGTRIGDRPEFDVVVNDRAVTRAELLAQFEASDILHVAGQVEYDPPEARQRLRLADGRVSAADLGRLPAGATVPRLVFVTACEAEGAAGGAPGEPAVFGLASAILMAGVKHFIGSLRAAPDSAGFQFADDLIGAGRGQSIGVAMREARRAAVRRFGKTELTWTASVLYGDPSTRYVTPSRAQAVPAGPAVLERRRLLRLLVGVAAGVVVAGGLYFMLAGGGGKAQIDAAYRHLEGGRLAEAARDFEGAIKARPAEAYEGLALVALRQGDPTAAQKFCAEAQKVDARRPGCVLVQGDTVAQQGDLTKAAANYESVVSFAACPGSRSRSRTAAWAGGGRARSARPRADCVRRGAEGGSRTTSSRRAISARCSAPGQVRRGGNRAREGRRDQPQRRHGPGAPEGCA
jgi:hypothetical protein